jgi:hypothetical protein
MLHFQGLARKFPANWNREIVSAKQGINSPEQGITGNSRPDRQTGPTAAKSKRI